MTDDPTGTDPNGTSTDPSVNATPVSEANREHGGKTPACPLCESERIEQINMPDELLAYRCLDCIAEYDETGERVRFE